MLYIQTSHSACFSTYSYQRLNNNIIIQELSQQMVSIAIIVNYRTVFKASVATATISEVQNPIPVNLIEHIIICEGYKT